MAKEIGYGAELLCGTTTGGSVTVAQIRSISGPDSEADMVDTTTLDSSTNYRTFVQGLADPGQVTVELVYDSTATSHAKLQHYHDNRISATYTIVYPTSANSQAFTAYVQSLSLEVPLDDLITQTVTLKITGDPGWSS